MPFCSHFYAPALYRNKNWSRGGGNDQKVKDVKHVLYNQGYQEAPFVISLFPFATHVVLGCGYYFSRIYSRRLFCVRGP